MTTNSVADLMNRNLLGVFNERDPELRALAIEDTYADDVVWHESDRINLGREALARRAEQLLGETPGWVFQAHGPISVLDDIGHLGFCFGPSDQPPAVIGMDIARCDNGVIIELYTLGTEINQPSSGDA
jgi:hypothetical protein